MSRSLPWNTRASPHSKRRHQFARRRTCARTMRVDVLGLFRPEQGHDAERAAGKLLVREEASISAGDELRLGPVDVLLLSRMAAGTNTSTSGGSMRSDCLRNAKRLDEAVVEAVAVRDDGRHAAEVLTQHHLLGREDGGGQVIERLLRRQLGRVGLVGQEAVPQFLDAGGGDEAAVRRDLLVVADHQDLLAAQHRRQRPQVRLARFVHDHQVEGFRGRAGRSRTPWRGSSPSTAPRPGRRAWPSGRRAGNGSRSGRCPARCAGWRCGRFPAPTAP